MAELNGKQILLAGLAPVYSEMTLSDEPAPDAPPLRSITVDGQIFRTDSDRIYIRYSAYEDGTDFTAAWTIGQNFIGIATGSTVAPTDKSSYVWSRFAQNPVDESGLWEIYFEDEDTGKNTCCLSKYLGTTAPENGVLVIPATINGYRVRKIQRNGSYGYYDEDTGTWNTNNAGSIWTNADARAGTKKIIVPEGVEIIGAFGFYNSTATERVVLPSSLRRIEYGSFYNMKELGNIDFPKGLEYIGSFAFAISSSGHVGTKLWNFDIENTEIETIGRASFQLFACEYGATKPLDFELKLPKGIVKLCDFAFNQTNSFGNEELFIPRTLKQINGNDDCEEESKIPTHVLYRFAELTFKRFVVSQFNENFQAIDGILYNKTGTILYAIPAKVELADNHLIMPDTVQYMAELCFSCVFDNIKKLTISDGLLIEEMELNGSYCQAPYDAFINGGNTLSNAIYNYAYITEVVVKSTNTKYKSVDGCVYTKDGQILWYVPQNKTGAITMPEGCTVIKRGAFGTDDVSASLIKWTSFEIGKDVNDINEYSLAVLNRVKDKVTVAAGNTFYEKSSDGTIVLI